MSMRPSIKTNIHSTKRGDIQTTMSANLLNKTRSRQMTTKLSRTQAPHAVDHDTKTKISPFLLEFSSNQQNDHKKSDKELNAVKNINYEYIQLFHSLFTNNASIKDSTNILNKQKLTREQRYQLQCMKLLKKATASIERINFQRKVSQDWSKISSYVANHPQISANKQLKTSQQLITKYKSIEQELQKIEQQYKQLVQKTEQNMQNIIKKPDISLSRKQKQYKQTQKKLNKITNQQQYYMAKLEKQQEELQQLQQKIKRSQQNKLSLQMKVISQKAKKDRLVRKAKQKRENSLTPKKPGKQQEKAIRSKSSIRFNIMRFTQ